jgi:hypothetical protein
MPKARLRRLIRLPRRRCIRDAEAERLGGLEVDRKLERRRLLGWIGAVENFDAAGVDPVRTKANEA